MEILVSRGHLVNKVQLVQPDLLDLLDRRVQLAIKDSQDLRAPLDPWALPVRTGTLDRQDPKEQTVCLDQPAPREIQVTPDHRDRKVQLDSAAVREGLAPLDLPVAPVKEVNRASRALPVLQEYQERSALQAT